MFIWLQHTGSLVAACELLGHMGSFPDQGLNLGPLHWERGAFAPRLPKKSLISISDVWKLRFGEVRELASGPWKWDPAPPPGRLPRTIEWTQASSGPRLIQSLSTSCWRWLWRWPHPGQQSRAWEGGGEALELADTASWVVLISSERVRTTQKLHRLVGTPGWAQLPVWDAGTQIGCLLFPNPAGNPTPDL